MSYEGVPYRPPSTKLIDVIDVRETVYRKGCISDYWFLVMFGDYEILVRREWQRQLRLIDGANVDKKQVSRIRNLYKIPEFRESESTGSSESVHVTRSSKGKSVGRVKK